MSWSRLLTEAECLALRGEEEERAAAALRGEGMTQPAPRTGTITPSSTQRRHTLMNEEPEKPFAKARVIADLRRTRACLCGALFSHMPAGDRLALWLCCYLDYCVIRYNNVNWGPSAPGARLLSQALSWLTAVQSKFAARRLPGIGWIDFGDLNGWQVTEEPLTVYREVADVALSVMRSPNRYTYLVEEPMGTPRRGEILSTSFQAVAAHILASSQLDGREVCSILLAQCESYQLAGSNLPFGEAVNRALALVKHTAFKERLAAGR